MIVVLAVLAVLFILGLSFAGVFRVRQVTVTGNAYYTKEEVVDLLLDEGSLQNTLLVYLRYKYQEHPEIPFIDDFEVTMDSWQSLKIRVYEKNMVGYVRYLGQDVYFDKDGIVVESSTQELEGIPQISGVTFDSLAIHQPLSVEDPTIFDTILSITKLLTKYDLDPDEIRLQTRTCRIQILGTCLGIEYYTRDEMMITGQIISVNMEARGGKKG